LGVKEGSQGATKKLLCQRDKFVLYKVTCHVLANVFPSSNCARSLL